MFRPIRLKPMKLKPMQVHFNLDLDRDNVQDWKDCQPFNPYKQEEEELVKELKEAYGKVKGKLSKETQEKLEPVEKAVEPYVEKAEGMEDVLKEKLKGAKEKVKEKYKGTTFAKSREYKKAMEQGEEQFKSLPTYLLVKIKGDKWYNWGEIPTESITLAQMKLKEIERHPNIEHAKLSKDPAEVNKLNRGITKRKVSQVGAKAKDYLEKRGFGENIKSGMEISPQGRASMSSYAQGPGARPPRTPWQPNLPSQQRMGYPEEEGYQRPREQYGYSQRSPHYQEQSAFGPSVVPYRPIGRLQVTAPNNPVSFPMTRPTRPPGMLVGVPPRSFSFKPVTFNFYKIGYRRRI